jgi:hypothetical protein
MRLTRQDGGMTMTWIADMTSRIARSTGIDEGTLTIGADEAEELLRLAGVAAHTSGDRTNAPLLCHVLGRAVALGAPLDSLAQVIDSATGD